MDGAVGSEASLLLRGSTEAVGSSSSEGSMGGRGGPEGSIGGLLKYWLLNRLVCYGRFTFSKLSRKNA